MPEKRIVRLFCKRCQKWYEELLDPSELDLSPVGVFSVAFDHGDHVLTVFLDEQFAIRGDNVADKVAEDSQDEKSRALEYFEKY
ncbi:MAG: hypothetical protein GF411_13265 [Candidatus Lokiarchaeota archaeon]|nr:hypothetical protein [Candidatus Lokiarchaeota archaeon]